MSADAPILAIGHTWDLAIEEAILNAAGHALLDARRLALDDPLWQKTPGILLGSAHKLDAVRLAALKNARAVVRYGIGYDNIDVAAADARGIVVAIVRDYCLDEVAEHALACALSLARGLPHWDRAIRAGAWREGERPPLRRLSSLTFGVIGFGLIGRTVAAKAAALFGRIVIHDPVATISAIDRELGYEFAVSLPGFLKEIDIVSIHVPLTAATRSMIGAKELALMKPSASVINVSRGGIVNEEALLKAVQERRIYGAALDTFVTEPLPARDPLLAEPNIILSPHIAWLSEEAELKLRQRASEEMAIILAGREPAFPVTRAKVAR